ncbi:MAG: response regulator [Reinekea sp.]|jgi:CheY-like chemotaxis protein
MNDKTVSILLVEDDDVDAMSIERSLKKMQLSNPIVRAVDGVEALHFLREGIVQRPYIILLDLNLPRMGGLEFLSLIRKEKEINDAIVFVLTTSKSEEEINKAYQRNVAGYIVKSASSQGFDQILTFLESYWCLVELPSY